MSVSRKEFLSLGLVGAATLALGRPAQAQLVEKAGDWSPKSFHALMNRSARYRQVYDITVINQGTFLNNIKNSLNGFQFSYGATPAEINIVAALHGSANLLNFDDAMWAKYRLGEYAGVKDPATGAPAARNIFHRSKADASNRDPNDEKSIYQDHSIEGLQKRAVKFLICHTATEEQARKLIQRFGLSAKPEEIVNDLLAHKLPGSMVVPAMVAAVAVLQLEGRFSYITVA